MFCLLLSAIVSNGQTEERSLSPIDTLWIFTSEADSLRSDSIKSPRNTAANRSDEAYDVKIPDFMYKSPEAYAFRKYGEYGVSEYTGTTNITVPLYTVSYKDVEIPITLAYDASGIRVDQEASWVGLGWNLMVGGCINYVAAGSIDPKLFNASQTTWENFLNTGSGDIYHFTSDLRDNNSYLALDIKSGHGERDFFSVNILGKSFLFSINPFTDSITVIGCEAEKYVVEIDNVSSYGQLNSAVWKVTDGNGWQYYFSPGELTNAFVMGGAYTSTWNLTEIITQEGSVVDFLYSNPIYVPYRSYRTEQYDILGEETNPGHYPNPGYSSQFVQTNVSVQTRYLSAIETRDQRVSFTLNDRVDLPSGQRLEKISVYSKISKKTIREFNFSYGYFSASNVGGNYLNVLTGATPTDDFKYRLKLNAVTEAAGSTSLTTTFTYNESFTLPLKTSCAKDFWGYFNNKQNSGSAPILSTNTLLPTPLPLFINSGVQLSQIYRSLKGANRYCDVTAMQAAMLTKITYPTKGYTTFTYEPNRFMSTTRYPTTEEYASCTVNKTLMDSNHPNETVHSQIDLTENTYGLITVTFSGVLSDLKNAGASVTITPLNPSMGSPLTYNLMMASDADIAFGTYFTRTLPIDLQGTSYMMVVNCPNSLGSTGYYVMAELSATQAFTDRNVPVSTGGGLRIKSIRNYHHDGSLEYQTDYEYTDESGNCSGKLLQPLSFSQMWHVICAYQSSGCSDPGCIVTYDYNLNRLMMPSTDVPAFFTSLAGGTVGYSRVKKLRKNGNGETLSTEVTEYINELPKWVWNIHYFTNDSNGHVKQQVIADSVSGTIRRKTYTYSNELQRTRCNAIVFDRVIDFSDLGFSMPSRYDVRIYPFYTSWTKLDSMTETTFDSNNSMTKTNVFTYNSQNHLVRSMTENSSIDNTSYITEYKYPFDFPGESACSLMCRSPYHILNPVIEQSTSIVENGVKKLIHKRKDTYMGYTNKYRDLHTNSRVFLLKSSSFVLNGASQETRLYYNYNAQCDKTDITKDSEKVGYLWAYNYMYPVAEIKGATYSDLISWNLSTQIADLTDKTDSSQISAILATIRASLANRPVLMTTYTYDPLIGMTSMTAPNGTKTSYTYDVMGRLSSVKNHGGNTIQQYYYNYKNN